MNIFIYGSDGFKQDIHTILDKSNVKLHLSEDDIIEEIGTLIELRTAIENYPKDIFLIDDSKIFKQNGLNEKIEFLKPSDAIEEKFIKEHMINNLQINSLQELPQSIIKKLESLKEEETLDIEESIISMVDDAYEKEKQAVEVNNSNDDSHIELDDELSHLLVSEEISEKVKRKDKEMDDELDALTQSDILDALDGLDDMDFSVSQSSSNMIPKTTNSSMSNNLSSSSVNEVNSDAVLALITQLLNNKTVEITIKIKE